MAVHKLVIDDFISVDYGLIAIHSSLEDSRLAYFINRQLAVRLQKCPFDISFKLKNGKSYFSRFLFEDQTNCAAWNLIQNKNSMVSTQTNNTALFFEAGFSETSTVYLLPELKKVDYLLKIDNIEDEAIVTDALEGLSLIKNIATAYKVDHHTLKSKNNLIF